MARGRRLRKSTGGELEMSKENGIASDDAILLPNVVVSNEVDAEPHVVLQQISQLVSKMVLYHN